MFYIHVSYTHLTFIGTIPINNPILNNKLKNFFIDYSFQTFPIESMNKDVYKSQLLFYC